MRRLMVVGGCAVLAGAIAAAVLLTTGSSTSAAAAVVQAAKRTTDAGSSRVEIRARDEDGPVAMSGVFDYKRGKAAFTDFDFGGLSEEARKFYIDEFRLIGDTMYIKMPALAQATDSHRAWFRMSFEQEDDQLGALFWMRFLNPVQLMTYLESVTRIERVRRDSVRGVETTRYRGIVDLERVIEREPAAKQAKLREELASAKRTTLPFEVWIDDEGLARRLKTTDWSTENPQPGTVDFFDFGIKTNIEAPPLDQVTDVSGGTSK